MRPDAVEGAIDGAVVHIVTVAVSLGFLRSTFAMLADRGVEVHAICSSGGEAYGVTHGLKVPVHSVTMHRRITPFRDLAALLRLISVIRRIRPAIVHAHTPKAGLLGMIAASLAGVPIRVYHLRGLPLQGARGLKRTMLTWSELVSCRLAHRVISVGTSMRTEAIRLGLAEPDHIRVLADGSGQGVDASVRFCPERVGHGARDEARARWCVPAEAPVIGFVGRVVRDKGVVELAEAWQLLRCEFPDAYLLVAGEFEPQDPVPEQTRRLLENDERIVLAGHVDDTGQVYAAVDVVALPTYREGFPNVTLEAAAMERPVVATRIPPCEEAVVDGVTGLLVPVHDAEALAAALARYLDDPALAREHGAAGRARVLARFQPERIANALFEEYLELIAAVRGPVHPIQSDHLDEG